jgi:NAD-dependent histone deacetylase SIR2
LLPGKYEPTAAHFFIRLLHEKGLLLRCFTQNIDTLEREAGLPGEAVVEAHGSFAAYVFFFFLCRGLAERQRQNG